jgi:hypothetical protein
MKPTITPVYELRTDRNREFWVTATSPERAISKLKRRGRKLLDRGEKIVASRHVGDIDVD